MRGEVEVSAGASEATFRRATRDDWPFAVDLIYGHPAPEVVAVTGDPVRARAFGLRFGAAVAGHELDPERTVIIERDGRSVGVLVGVTGPRSDLRIGPRLVWDAVRTLGLAGALRIAKFQRLRHAVSPQRPSRAYHIAEVHVVPECRGQGLGTAALDHAEDAARAEGYAQLSLITSTANPARRLYERCGFRVVETRTDPEHERLTGVVGRILMQKDLHEAHPPK